MESRRQQQVGRQIQQTLSDVFRKHGFSIYGRAMVTVSQVRLTPDLGIARVYLSIYNTDEKQETLDSIISNGGFLRKSLGNQMRNKIRSIPDMEYFMDDTLDEVFKLDAIFKKIEKEREGESDEQKEE